MDKDTNAFHRSLLVIVVLLMLVASIGAVTAAPGVMAFGVPGTPVDDCDPLASLGCVPSDCDPFASLGCVPPGYCDPAGSDPNCPPGDCDLGISDPGLCDPGGPDPGGTDPGDPDPGDPDPGGTDQGTPDPGVSSPDTTIEGESDPGASGAAGTEPSDTSPGSIAAVTPRPAHIHAGSCPDVGDVVAPLSDLLWAGGATWTDASGAIPAAYSFTTVPLTLNQILSSEYAINVHESAGTIQTSIACGDLAGTVDANGTLVVGLRQANGSGYAGIAVLSPNPIDGASTDASVFVASDLMAGGGP